MKLTAFSLALFFLISLAPFQNSPASPVTSSSVKKESVGFTLRNNSLKSIPLIIPGVMNPNLSPVSNSRVSLKIGQKILFKYKGKKRILLIVDESYEGQKVDVAQLLKERKREIDKKK